MQCNIYCRLYKSASCNLDKNSVIFRHRKQRALEALELSPQEKAAMVELAVTMNDEIFEGTLAENAERILQDPAWGLWQSRGKNLFFGQYLQAMLSEAKPGNNEITITLR